MGSDMYATGDNSVGAGGDVCSSVESGAVNIGLFHPYAITRSSGGIAVYTRRLTEALSELTPTFLYAKDGPLPDSLADSPANVVPIQTDDSRLDATLSSRLPNPVGYVLRRSSIYRGLLNPQLRSHVQDNVDAIVTHDYLDELVVSNFIDVPTIRIQHSLKNVGIGTFVGETFSRSAVTVANSRSSAREVETKLGYEPDAIVSPGVDLDVFHPDAEPAFRSGGTDVLYVGRLVEEKGIYDLLEAIERLSTEATLHVVGRGDVQRVLHRAAALGIEDSVVYHGTVSHERLPGYYTACDVFCNPSHYETFGMVNLEAMACGAPLVSSDLDAAEEYLVPGDNGLIAPVGDSAALADRLERVATTPSLRREFGRAGRATASEYSWSSAAKRLREVAANASRGGVGRSVDGNDNNRMSGSLR